VQLTDFGAPEIMALTHNGIRRDWSRIDLAFAAWRRLLVVSTPVSPNSMKSFRVPSAGATNIYTASLSMARPMGFRTSSDFLFAPTRCANALAPGSVADRCKYLLHIHLTFNVRGHWDEFAVAIRAPWCQGSRHGSPSLTSSSTLSSTLVRRRHYHHLCTVVFAL
jgi:hypothetical protein